MGNIRIASEILVKKCEKMRLLGRKRQRKENTGVGCIDVNYIHLAQLQALLTIVMTTEVRKRWAVSQQDEQH